MVGGGENAVYQHIPFFLKCFLKQSSSGSLKIRDFMVMKKKKPELQTTGFQQADLGPYRCFFYRCCCFILGAFTLILRSSTMHIFADSVDQDQTAHTCSLILLYTLRFSIMNFSINATPSNTM